MTTLQMTLLLYSWIVCRCTYLRSFALTDDHARFVLRSWVWSSFLLVLDDSKGRRVSRTLFLARCALSMALIVSAVVSEWSLSDTTCKASRTSLFFLNLLSRFFPISCVRDTELICAAVILFDFGNFRSLRLGRNGEDILDGSISMSVGVETSSGLSSFPSLSKSKDWLGSHPHIKKWKSE